MRDESPLRSGVASARSVSDWGVGPNRSTDFLDGYKPSRPATCDHVRWTAGRWAGCAGACCFEDTTAWARQQKAGVPLGFVRWRVMSARPIVAIWSVAVSLIYFAVVIMNPDLAESLIIGFVALLLGPATVVEVKEHTDNG